FLNFFFLLMPSPLISPLFPYTTLFRSRFIFRPPAVTSAAANVSKISSILCAPLMSFKETVKGSCVSSTNTFPSPSRERVPSIGRSEEHTSELQSLRHLVCRLLLEKKKI